MITEVERQGAGVGSKLRSLMPQGAAHAFLRDAPKPNLKSPRAIGSGATRECKEKFRAALLT
jgi:hypothetical protein